MSKAFTRESDDSAEEMIAPRPSSSLPPGATNYMTPDGAGRLRAELHRLVNEERPAMSAEPDEAGEVKRRLQRLDLRIQQIEEALRTAVITPPPSNAEERREVRFGATVTIRRGGEDVRYRIVGVDEAEPERGWVSWPSPIARALLQARVGDSVRFRFPSGEETLEVAAVDYEEFKELL
jgi:transcription elongation factor GreB